MAGLTTSSTPPAAAPPATKHPDRWKWFLGLGALLLVLGMAGVGIATLLQLTTILVFGPILLASGILQFLTAFFAEERKERLLHYLAAGVEFALGLVIMVHPFERVIGLVAVIAIFLMVSGLVRLGRSVVAQSPRRGWVVMTGVVALVLGVSVWVGGPAARLGFVAFCIALDLLCHGVAWSVLALTERKPLQESAP